MRFIDLTNQKFGLLTALERIPNTNPIKWKCICDCGNFSEVQGRYLREGHTRSCGCLQRQAIKQIGLSTKKDLTGKTFNFLTVIEDSGRRQKTEVIWKCQCICGNITYVASGDLIREKTKSCGCKKLYLNSLDKTINIEGNRFGKLIAIKKQGQDKDKSWNYLCKCDCGNFKIINGVSLRQGVTTSCGCINYSIGENNIKTILDDNNILYIKEFCIKELQNKRMDFAILNNNNQIIRFIEYDGIQHYQIANPIWESSTTLAERQQHDKEKNQYALSHNIPLVRIPYWERDKITLEMIMGDQYLVKE